MNLNFEHFWSQNKTTGHVLLSSVFVCMDSKTVRPPDLSSDKLRELGTGIYCKFNPRIERMGSGWHVINVIQGSVWRFIQDKDPNVRSMVEFDDYLGSGGLVP
jgi:hypothetical protein